jgi:DNA ligase-1
MSPPPMMLAHHWTDKVDPTGWLMSEKLDGIRAWWDGSKLVTKLGNTIAAPAWFLKGLPSGLILEGELWAGRGNFAKVTSTVRKKVPVDKEWWDISYVLFDVPKEPGTFRIRSGTLRVIDLPSHVRPIELFECVNQAHMEGLLEAIVKGGGEGLMLHDPRASYEEGRSHSLLKVKQEHDAEATVVGYEPGEGKHLGRVGALLVKSEGGVGFKIGTGLTDDEREHPPRIGAQVTFRYTEWPTGGKPRHARFLRVREET